MTRKRLPFRPEAVDPLERRVALTHGGPITPALIGTLSPTPQASGRAGRVVTQINAAFDRFTRDYFQAQGAYLASDAAQGTFTAFTTQRVKLLAQELTRVFARLPGSFARIQDTFQRSSTGSDVLLQAILRRNVNGTGTTANTGSQSLLSTLNSPSVVPPAAPKPTGAGATLYTLTATNAIGTARNATINAAKFLASGTFPTH